MKLKDLFKEEATQLRDAPWFRDAHKHINFSPNESGILTIPGGVRSHILGVMRIKGLKRISFFGGDGEQQQVARIVNKHLPGGNIHEVQEELIEAGFKEYAKL